MSATTAYATATSTAPRRACTDHVRLFSAQILDYSPNNSDYADLTPTEHAEHAEARTSHENAAKAICAGCPALELCRREATEKEVYGVAAGMTAAERRGHNPNLATPDLEVEFADGRDRFWRGRVNDEVIARLTRAQWTNEQIAHKMGCSTRTVARARARMREGNKIRITSTTLAAPTPITTEVIKPLNPHRATSAMQAVYDVLADGRWHDREDLLAVAVPLITDAEALAWFSRRNPNDHQTPTRQRITMGARAVADNRLSASARTRGRTVYNKTAKQYCIAEAAVRPAA